MLCLEPTQEAIAGAEAEGWAGAPEKCETPLHADMRASLGLEPIAQLHQVLGKRSKGPDLLSWLLVGLPNQQTCHDRRLVNVESTNALKDRFHRHLAR